MKYYTKNNVIKTPSSIIVEENGRQILNPTHQTLIDNGWEEYIKPEPTFEEQLSIAKESKKQEVLQYDSSEEINIFYIQDLPVWLDKATRAGLKLRFDAEIASGKIDTILWYNNNPFQLSLELAVQMLYAIELYASACYDNTQYHVAQISNLETLEDVSIYDYTTGYPEKLNF